MSNKTMVTLCEGGSQETTKPIDEIEIPNLWHIAMALEKTGRVENGPGCAKMILDCWNRTHDFKNHILQLP